MKKILKVVGFLLLLVILACGFSWLTDKNNFNKWEIKHKDKLTATIPWAKFVWSNDSLGGKYYERTGMHIPASIDGLPYQFSFQFDLGADHTMLYENNLASLFDQQPALRTRYRRLKSFLQFWNKARSFKNVTISFGELNATTVNCFVQRNYGEALNFSDLTDSSLLPLGTIGADIFQGHVLIIDYPNQRFSICESIPQDYTTTMIDIELDRSGRVVLPMKLKGKAYRVLFDNGSSLFPLITMAKNIQRFSSGPDTDTIPISSWGKVHDVTGKMITDTVELAGKKFVNTKIYANHAGLGIDAGTDAMAGNALFWNNTIIIDFKNRKFGIK